MEKGVESNIEEINEIIIGLRGKVAENERNMWDSTYPKEENFQEDIDKGNLYILKEENEIVGFYTISEELEYDDDMFEEKDSYVVIHRFAVKYEKMKQGYGTKMLNEVYGYCKTRGIKSIRLDTFSKNISSNKFYLKNGFMYVGTITLEKGLYNCYERILTNE